MNGVPSHVVVCATGSIGVLSLPTYFNHFYAAGVARVSAVLSQAAANMIPPSTWSYICDAVCTDNDPGPGHIALRRDADAVLVMPATANTVAAIAAGTCANFVTLLAATGPCVVSPMMNTMMWERPATRRNIATLEEDGHVVLMPPTASTFEVASRSFVSGPVLPAPTTVLDALAGLA